MSHSLPQLQIHPAYSRLPNSLSAPAGYVAPAKFQCDRPTEAAALADEILRDPLKMHQLAERVYELLVEDMHRQQERDRNYGGKVR